MIFTSSENQMKVVHLMEVIDSMHRNVDMSLTDADSVELAVAFMIRHLLANNGDNVVISYDLADKLNRVGCETFKQVCVRLMPHDMVVTRIYLTNKQSYIFSVIHHDGSAIIYDDFRTLLESEDIMLWGKYEYIRHAFVMGWRWLDTYRRAHTWSKAIIQNAFRGYYNDDHDYLFCKFESAVTKFIDSTDDQVSLNDIINVIESLN